MNGEHEKGFEGIDEMKMGGDWTGCMGMGHMHQWPKQMKKEFMMAMLKKKEKMLEAKLEFVREMRRLSEKSEMEGRKETEEAEA
ncbi:MAG TPA: hypothetical protein VK254_03305 [Candidatus Bathyarchaeia archaeon]|nr:hypothetical protein [Candidatus Bathyarchaeia archaeon]